MKSRATIVFALSFFLFTTGCLDALRNSSDSNEFWGEDCKDLSEEICTKILLSNFVKIHPMHYRALCISKSKT